MSLLDNMTVNLVAIIIGFIFGYKYGLRQRINQFQSSYKIKPEQKQITEIITQDGGIKKW